MLSECLSAVADLAAELWNLVRRLDITFPNLYQEVLAVLMTLPVILAAKPFGAAFKCTTIRLVMTLHVLSEDLLAHVSLPLPVMWHLL